MQSYFFSHKTLKNIAYGVIVATFFVPLIVVPESFIFPFIVPKILYFRTLVLVLVGVYALLYISQPKLFGPRGTVLSYAVLMFAASLALSTFFGVDWYRSLWDNHERMLGLFTLFHFIFYYTVATTVIQSDRAWRQLFRVFGLIGSCVMFIGVLQHWYPNMLLNMGNTRVSATLGNPIYFSGFGMYLVFVGAWLLLEEQSKVWKWYGSVVAMLGLCGILLGGTRGTLVGLIIGVIVALGFYAFFLKQHKQAQIVIRGILAVVALLIGALIIFRHTAFVASIPGVGRLASTNLSGGDTADTRFIAWSIGVESAKEHPVFGWGLNNYYYAFNKYYRPEILRNGWGETWFDNAHNVFVNTLTTQGVVGFVSYLALFAAAGYVLIRGYRTGRTDIHLMSLSVAFLFGHMVHNFFVFEDPTSYLYFFFFLAYINAKTAVPVHEQQSETLPNRRAPLFATALVFCIVAAMVYSTDVKPAIANQATLEALKYITVDPAVTFAQYEKAIAASSPHVDDIRNDFARSATDALPQYIAAKRFAEANTLFQYSYSGLKQNLLLHPLDIRVHIELASLLQLRAQYTQEGRDAMQEESSVLEQALLRSPRRQQIQYMLATTYLALGRGDSAIAILSDAVKNEPKVGESWWRLAVVQTELKQWDKAAQTLRDADAAHTIYDERGVQITAQLRQAIASSTPAIRTKK